MQTRSEMLGIPFRGMSLEELDRRSLTGVRWGMRRFRPEIPAPEFTISDTAELGRYVNFNGHLETLYVGGEAGAALDGYFRWILSARREGSTERDAFAGLPDGLTGAGRRLWRQPNLPSQTALTMHWWAALSSCWTGIR